MVNNKLSIELSSAESHGDDTPVKEIGKVIGNSGDIGLWMLDEDEYISTIKVAEEIDTERLTEYKLTYVTTEKSPGGK